MKERNRGELSPGVERSLPHFEKDGEMEGGRANVFGLEKRAALSVPHSPPEGKKGEGEFVRKGKYKKGSLCAEQCKKVEEKRERGREGRSIAKKVMKRESRRGTAPFSLLLSSPFPHPQCTTLP